MARGFAVAANVSADVVRATAREAEALGYTSFWVNHPGSVDGLAALAHAARETRRLELGVGVIPLHTRPPDSIVEGVTTHALPTERLLLGVGSPNPEALKRVRESVAALRRRLTTRVVVAALGPQMCRLAGEIADGVLFNWITPEQARRSAELVRAGAAAAGRRPPKVFAYLRIALGAGGATRLRQEADRYAAIPAYASHFARMGVKPVDTAIAADSPAALAKAVGAWQGDVDEIVLRAITSADSAEETLALVRAAAPA